MTDDLVELLGQLKLYRIRDILDRELKKTTSKKPPSYSEFLATLLREETIDKRERRTQNRIRQARLPEAWSLESFPFDKQPSLAASVIYELAELEFIPKAQNLVFIGGTGVGKTGISISLLRKALQNGYRGLFIKAQDLFDHMYTSLADHSTRTYINHLANLDLLLIDEMGYLNLRPEQANIFFKLMEERYHRKSTIITTNLEYDDWYGFLGNKLMVEALLSRLRHHCHTVRIDGQDLREPMS